MFSWVLLLCVLLRLQTQRSFWTILCSHIFSFYWFIFSFFILSFRCDPFEYPHHSIFVLLSIHLCMFYSSKSKNGVIYAILICVYRCYLCDVVWKNFNRTKYWAIYTIAAITPRLNHPKIWKHAHFDAANIWFAYSNIDPC